MATCPVCGYKKLEFPIAEYPVCPSCYTEFGYDDSIKSITELRQAWIDADMPWCAVNVMPVPSDWDPKQQLRDLLTSDTEGRAEYNLNIKTDLYGAGSGRWFENYRGVPNLGVVDRSVTV